MFYEKTINNFLNSEHKIIYAEKRVNNFLNNAEHKIILCKMLEIILCYLVLFLCLFVDYPKKKKIIRDSSLPNLSSILLIFMFLFICQLSQKKNCKELELGELKYLRKTLPSILFTKNSSLYARVPY